MPVLTVEIDQSQETSLRQVPERNPGWTKSLVIRALLDYFLKLEAPDQENLVKTHRVKPKKT